jgi:NhaA family Na+:H+ antiporter
MQQIGIGSALAYILPGALIWFGLFKTGVHPTLAGVLLGLMTPVVPLRMHERPVDLAKRALNLVADRIENVFRAPDDLAQPLKELRTAQRELVPPVVRVQMALHPWVAYGVMPLFALANAGVSLEGIDLTATASQSILAGVAVALVLGKPVGILLGSWFAVRLGWCQLPPCVTWHGIALIGCLGGIGFTMSIFIANLAFSDEALLAATKAGVLLASVMAAIIGLLLGRIYIRRARATACADDMALHTTSYDQAR